jgi:hypothetical protein
MRILNLALEAALELRVNQRVNQKPWNHYKSQVARYIKSSGERGENVVYCKTFRSNHTALRCTFGS